jgi:uncharacterized protein (TIGR02453 family)
MTFSGFPAAAFEFYDRLEADNSKAFWQAHKATFDEAVKAPTAALCQELADVGPFHVFRPYNDLRFAKNRPPYKTHQGAYCESEGGAGHYFHLGADGMMVAVGYYGMARDQLDRFRAAVDDEASGTEIDRVVAALAKKGYSISAMDELKTVPRGYAKDHPRAELLRRKGLTAGRQFAPASWMHSKKAVAKIRETWAAAGPLCAWLDTHVGPSTLPPDDTFLGGRRG